MLEIAFRVADPHWKNILDQQQPLLETALQTAFAELDLPAKNFAVAVSLVDDAEIQGLNKQYRQKDKPTNVLSFPMVDDFDDLDGQPGAVELGDIILAFETIQREAMEQGKNFPHHIAHLLVHGFLHLVGFDHLTDTDAADMEALETDILAAMGIEDPYWVTEA